MVRTSTLGILITISIVISCSFVESSDSKDENYPTNLKNSTAANDSLIIKIDSSGQTILERFPAPIGYSRNKADSNSYTFYLRHLKLFPLDHEVRYYDGRIKSGEGIYCSVVDLPIGDRDRHQCADAVMNVRAHYLYSIGQYDQIHFNFVSGFNAKYSEWRTGKRIRINGNNVSWYQTNNESKSYNSFLEYLQKVYSYASTLSLEKELSPVSTNDILPGDVFIIGGSPGHAILVLDVLESDTTSEKLFLLGQSFMPAQELQVLINSEDPTSSPWYSNKDLKALNTPQWRFDEGHLRRFKD